MKAGLAIVGGLALALCGTLARSDERQTQGAGQVAGLFMQTCVQFAGDNSQILAWLDQRHVPKLSAQMLMPFLQGRPGIGYDASNQSGRFALTLESGGLCTAYAQQSDSAELFRILEGLLTGAHLDFKQLTERADPREPGLRHRSYVVTKMGRPYTVVISTSAKEGIQAFLSLAPHNPNDPL